ncbi:hypothetical protein [Luteimonas deserti]|uniref:Uncharacterized protein n=1 Tax=Luteimonas deserti TaxID=2752306 RepID=A0A7Z0TXQ9_9GAMM|nr:hypothetical protein [Luteimonas deserti]NYZ62060.1 hypothetical protein [Luteimonas deserti]
MSITGNAVRSPSAACRAGGAVERARTVPVRGGPRGRRASTPSGLEGPARSLVGGWLFGAGTAARASSACECAGRDDARPGNPRNVPRDLGSRAMRARHRPRAPDIHSADQRRTHAAPSGHLHDRQPGMHVTDSAHAAVPRAPCIGPGVIARGAASCGRVATPDTGGPRMTGRRRPP